GLLAGAIAGIGSWLVGEAALDFFRPPLQRTEMMGQVIFKANFEDEVSADYKNATIAFAALGGVLGLALGVAGGWARKSKRSAVIAGTAGFLLGDVLATVASLSILPVYFHALDKAEEELSHDLVLPLIVHGGIWAVCGLAGGIAFGIGLGGGWRR